MLKAQSSNNFTKVWKSARVSEKRYDKRIEENETKALTKDFTQQLERKTWKITSLIAVVLFIIIFGY